MAGEIACPQFKNSFALTYKGFFYGKEVRKAQPFSGMLWLTWDFEHLPLKSFVSVKGPQHFLVTWSMIRPFISRESWFRKFLLVKKITMINSDFKIFSSKSFPNRLERPDQRRRRKLNLHVHVNKFFISTWPRWMNDDINRFKTWFVNHFVLNFQQLHCFQNVRNVFESLWFGFDRKWSLHGSIHPRRKSPVFISIFVSY